MSQQPQDAMPFARRGWAQDLEIGGRTLPIDVWLTLACVGAMAALCAWVAQSLIRPGFSALSVSFAFGWIFVVLGLAFVTLGCAYAWIGWRVVCRDPVGRWAGVTLAAIVVVAFLLQQDQGATNSSLVLVIMVNAALLALCALGPGVKAHEQGGSLAAVPTAVALALVVARAEALTVAYVAVSILPLGQYQARYYLEGSTLAAASTLVFVFARRLLNRERNAAIIVAAIVALNGVLAVVAQRSQLSFLNAGLSAVVVWGLFGHPASRGFYNMTTAMGGWAATAAPAITPVVGPLQPPAGPATFPQPRPARVATALPQPSAPIGAVPLAWQPPPPEVHLGSPEQRPGMKAAVPQPPAPVGAVPLAWQPPPPQGPLPAPLTDAAQAPLEPPSNATSIGAQAVLMAPYVEAPPSPTPVLSAAPPSGTVEIDEATVARPALSAGGCTLVIAGRQDVIVAGPVVLGRKPSPAEEWPDAALETVPDDEKSLSRSHAVIRPAELGIGLLVRDLDSVNGTYLLAEGGAFQRLTAGQDTFVGPGSSLMFGAVRVEVLP